MRRTPYAILVAAVVLTLPGCSDDSDGDSAADATSTPAVFAGCEDGVDQDVAVEFQPVAGTEQEVDAMLGRNYNAVGAPCVDVFVWDVTKGWKLDHYEISADHGGGIQSSVRSTSEDFIEALRFTPIMDCARVHGELVFSKVGSPDADPARFEADTKICTRADGG
jgi:hypothetical protein